VLKQNHGPGPSPGPTSRHIQIYVNLKTIIHTYKTRNRWWCNGWVDVFEGFTWWRRFGGRTPRTPKYFDYNNHTYTGNVLTRPFSFIFKAIKKPILSYGKKERIQL
jgi:hypothetical protein